jgi:hypothetical protein
MPYIEEYHFFTLPEDGTLFPENGDGGQDMGFILALAHIWGPYISWTGRRMVRGKEGVPSR